MSTETNVQSILNLKSFHLTLQAQNPDCVVLVDNCYGEFVETVEPTAVVRVELSFFPSIMFS